MSQLSAWERIQESRHNSEMELADALAEMTDDQVREWEQNPCRRCNGQKRGKCMGCEV